MVWRKDDPQGNESGKMLWELVPYTRGLGLDIGCGPDKAFPHFIGVDNKKDTELFGIEMNPDFKVPDATSLPMLANDSYDFVFSSHMLEHVEDYQACLREWWRLIKPGGHLCLYLPHKNFYPNIGQLGANPDHKHDFLPSDIEIAMRAVGSWDLVRNEDRNENMEYSFFQVYKKIRSSGPYEHRYSHKKPRPEKKVGVVRYGAWGDSLQMSSVLPELKKEGFHITVYTTPRAHEVIKDDPNIDEFIIQDPDQVPNSALSYFWNWEQKKYDRWVNLSESVEKTWLPNRDVSFDKWPASVRRKYLNRNYIEFAHDIAQVPYTKPNIRFYATLEEKNWAVEQRRAWGKGPIILWVLSGSSVHKVWPHLDQIFARILITWPKAYIVTVGDKRCEVLDQPWEKEKRVMRMSGRWGIRQTLAFAEQCDVIVGPETGVLSASSMLPMPKIVFLSHSTHENLTRDWINTYALFSNKTKCYPCHQLHYDWSTCWRNDDKKPDGTNEVWNGAAQCQVDIPPEACWYALVAALAGEDKVPLEGRSILEHKEKIIGER